MSFCSWLHYFHDIELIPAEMPGHGTRIGESCGKSFKALINELAEAVMQIKDERPVCFLGHSFGSLIAFQTAFVLQKNFGFLPEKIFVSARSAPSACCLSGSRCSGGMEKIKDEIDGIGGMPDEIRHNRAAYDFFMKIIFRDYQLNDEYKYSGEVVNTPIIAMNGADDKSADSQNMHEWSRMTNDSFRQYSFPGDHFYLYNTCTEAFLNTIHREICTP